MRIAPRIAAIALLAGCAHAPPLAPPPAGEPLGWVAIETDPAGARAVVTRGEEERLACAETPCRFALSPGPARIDLEDLGYSWTLEALAVAGAEDRYRVELRGGTLGGGFWPGVLLMLVSVPITVATARDDPGAAVFYGIPAVLGAVAASYRFIWPEQKGAVLSHLRSPAADAAPPPRR